MSVCHINVAPFTYTIDPENRQITVMLGQLDLVSVDCGVAAVSSDPSYDPAFDVILDCRLLDHMPDTDLVTSLARIWKRSAIGGAQRRWAVVADSLCCFGMARMFELFTEASDRIAVFRSVSEARRWLRTGEVIGREYPRLGSRPERGLVRFDRAERMMAGRAGS